MHPGWNPGRPGAPSSFQEVPTRAYADLHAEYLGPDRFRHPQCVEAHRADEHVSVGEAVRLAVRRYDQSSIGVQLAVAPREDEAAWLDADLG